MMFQESIEELKVINVNDDELIKKTIGALKKDDAIQELLDSNCFYGENDSPSLEKNNCLSRLTNISRFLTIDMLNIAYQITGYEWRGNELFIKVRPTMENAPIFKSDFDKSTYGAYMRYYERKKKNKIRIITFDLVTYNIN